MLTVRLQWPRREDGCRPRRAPGTQPDASQQGAGTPGTATASPLTALYRGDKYSMGPIEGITVAWSAIADGTSTARGGNQDLVTLASG